jgi:hypothetical protein
MKRLTGILFFAFLSLSVAGQVIDSTGSLRPFFDKLERRKGVVTVLHIGDSHVQAGVWTGRMRELLQRDYGNAGRGLIVPHKLAGMNEAKDYSITTRFAHHAQKAVGPTRVAVTFDVPFNEFSLWSKEPFDCVTVLHSERAPALFEPPALRWDSYCDMGNTPISTRIPLTWTVDSLTLEGFVQGSFDDPTYYGFVLENGRAGVLYHAVGLNGAAFEGFVEVARGALAMLQPDLVIVSLGTNNSFGPHFDAERLRGVVEGFVRDVKNGYPGAAVLMTTPMDACRRAGKYYISNPNVGAAARVIRETAAACGVACWDFYTAAGGSGAMDRWWADGLANRDHLHLSERGYVRQGDMMYEDLMKWQYSNK